MSYQDPDIQEAPVYPVRLEIIQDGKPTNFLSGNDHFTLYCDVFAPSSFIDDHQNTVQYIYASLLSGIHTVDEQKVAEVKIDPQNKPLVWHFEIPFKWEFRGFESINLQLAITSKHEGEMGLSEALRLGRFVNTFIPIAR